MFNCRPARNPAQLLGLKSCRGKKNKKKTCDQNPSEEEEAGEDGAVTSVLSEPDNFFLISSRLSVTARVQLSNKHLALKGSGALVAAAADSEY